MFIFGKTIPLTFLYRLVCTYRHPDQFTLVAPAEVLKSMTSYCSPWLHKPTPILFLHGFNPFPFFRIVGAGNSTLPLAAFLPNDLESRAAY